VSLLRHRLPAILDKPIGGCVGLVDVMQRKACDQALLPEEDPALGLPKVTVTGATSRNALLEYHGEHNPVTEIADILKLELRFLAASKARRTSSTRSSLVASSDISRAVSRSDRDELRL
jgi:hypothetical protein